MLFNPEAIVQAFDMVFTLKCLYWLIVGVVIGVGVGAMPGLTASTGVALMIPLTFTMSTANALALLIGLYKGAVYGGSISAISFATPGTPEAAATIYDGHKLMKKGQGRKAALMALYASVTADTLSDLITIAVAPALALVALKFGPTERFWLVVLAFTLLGSLSGAHLAKGMLSASFGIFLGTVGTDPVGMVSRMTFGIWWIQDGIQFIPLMIGIFAISRMLENAVEVLRQRGVTRKVKENFSKLLMKSGPGLTVREYIRCWKEMLIGLGVGSFAGMLPGLGATVGAFLSYSVAKQAFPGKKLGTGVLEGVAAAESGNNATVGPTLIPLLAFGIPGSATAALIGGALMLQGATPSPRMFELYPHVVYALFIILFAGNFVNLGVGRVFAGLYARLGQLPREILIPLILMMSIIGAYSYRGNPYDVVVMLIFGFIGYVIRILRIPDAPMVITFLITPMMEANLRRALLIHRGDWIKALFHSPLAIGLFISCVTLTFLAIRFEASKRLGVEISKAKPAE
ncbi:MAG: tripartite tricarboxylate transporter permease [Deltaproteobacteria bacterium]|nr:tripartite tricarboxylate transporter permease [Deltaproteobacteria bacterium]MBW1962126.1 tripartite tricarboxylate transporter permease [Deltaproteobacteria bacterium]MBW1993608.1 tripartite tricarboxylate transporter permease [Deltaproteobacteria bacterium]MBW2152970.1 tripartite tricarboxylate transporter permease [Deltaproteobacteria bacterium]